MDISALQGWLGKYVTIKTTSAFKQAGTGLLEVARKRCGDPQPLPNKVEVLEKYFAKRTFMVRCLQKK